METSNLMTVRLLALCTGQLHPDGEMERNAAALSLPVPSTCAKVNNCNTLRKFFS
jgi:hypothetical protein